MRMPRVKSISDTGFSMARNLGWVRQGRVGTSCVPTLASVAPAWAQKACPPYDTAPLLTNTTVDALSLIHPTELRSFVGWVRRALRSRWPFAWNLARAVTHRLAVGESVGYAAPGFYRGLEMQCQCAANPPYDTATVDALSLIHPVRPDRTRVGAAPRRDERSEASAPANRPGGGPPTGGVAGCRVDKPVGACHPQVRKRYIHAPLLTNTTVDALSLIHPVRPDRTLVGAAPRRDDRSEASAPAHRPGGGPPTGGVGAASAANIATKAAPAGGWIPW